MTTTATAVVTNTIITTTFPIREESREMHPAAASRHGRANCYRTLMGPWVAKSRMRAMSGLLEERKWKRE